MCQSLWLLTDVYYIPTVASLDMVVVILLTAVGLSLRVNRRSGLTLLPDLLMPDRFATYAQTVRMQCHPIVFRPGLNLFCVCGVRGRLALMHNSRSPFDGNSSCYTLVLYL
jgi:hypothetical protein